jgi:hypothetical protein
MPIEFTTLQRETLTAIVDTFVASVPREDDPDGYAARAATSADAATGRPSHTYQAQLAGLLQLIDAAGVFEFGDQPRAFREETRQRRGHLTRGGRRDRRAESAVGVVRLQPSGTVA